MHILLFTSYLKRFKSILTVSFILNSPLERLLVGFASDEESAPGAEITVCSIYLIILELQIVLIQLGEESSNEK